MPAATVAEPELLGRNGTGTHSECAAINLTAPV